jgi:ferredoxin, 2Fe-2S
MPKIAFVEASGQRHTVDAAVGDSVMQAAVKHAVPGIIGSCGGNCSCATCHVYIASPWCERVPRPSNDEQAMVECALHLRPTSRLGCQVQLVAELDGIVVELPESQL